MIKLRDYQEKGVNEIRNAYKMGRRRPLYVAPTGAGKTVIFSYISQNAAHKNKRVLILTHRIEILKQTSKALTNFGQTHGLINSKYRLSTKELIQVASIDSLPKKSKHFESFDLIVIDEAHHAVAKKWRRALDCFPDALVLGVTATPIRTDGKGLGDHVGGVFDSLILGPSIRSLIDSGYLVEPKIYRSKNMVDLSSVPMDADGDYDSEALEIEMTKPKIVGDAVAEYASKCPGDPAIVFCVSIKAANETAEAFRKAGFLAYAVDGKMDDARREALIAGLANGRVQVLTSCDIISEGTDIPKVACISMLRPTASLSMYLQMIGRGLRPSEGKDACIVFDHVGNTIRHGMPDSEWEWSLDAKPKKKKKPKKETQEEEPDVKVKQCPQCYRIHALKPNCPACGFIYPVMERKIEKVDGVLEEVTKEEKKLIARQNKIEVYKANSLADLEKIEKARGYKAGWAKHVWKAKQNKLNKNGNK